MSSAQSYPPIRRHLFKYRVCPARDRTMLQLSRLTLMTQCIFPLTLLTAVFFQQTCGQGSRSCSQAQLRQCAPLGSICTKIGGDEEFKCQCLTSQGYNGTGHGSDGCKLVNCPSLVTPSHGVLTVLRGSQPYQYDDLILYDCYMGYTPSKTRGRYQSVCGNNGQWSMALEHCEDLNECRDGTHNCHTSAVCRNIAGSFDCTCTEVGRISNGTHCVPTDISCPKLQVANGTWRYTPPSAMSSVPYGTKASLQCATGFTDVQRDVVCDGGQDWSIAGNGDHCQDIDECDASMSSCANTPNTDCQNTIGSYNCVCASGFTSNINGCALATSASPHSPSSPASVLSGSPTADTSQEKKSSGGSAQTLYITLAVALIVVTLILVGAAIGVVWWLRKRNRHPSDKGSVRFPSASDPGFTNVEYGSPRHIPLSVNDHVKPQYANGGMVDHTASARTSLSASLQRTTPTSPVSHASVFENSTSVQGHAQGPANGRKLPREVAPYRTTSILSTELKVKEVNPYMKPVDLLPPSTNSPSNSRETPPCNSGEGPTKRGSIELNTLPEEGRYIRLSSATSPSHTLVRENDGEGTRFSESSLSHQSIPMSLDEPIGSPV